MNEAERAAQLKPIQTVIDTDAVVQYYANKYIHDIMTFEECLFQIIDHLAKERANIMREQVMALKNGVLPPNFILPL